jgi:hypothetical protein
LSFHCSYEGFEEQDEVPVLYLAMPEGEEEEEVEEEAAKAQPAKKEEVKSSKDVTQKKSADNVVKTGAAAATDASKGASLDDDDGWGPSGQEGVGGAAGAEEEWPEDGDYKGHVVGFLVTLSEFAVDDFNDEFQVI